MKKILSIIQFIFILIVLPLLWNSALITTWPIITITLFIVLLLSTQPVMDIQESRANYNTDRGTMWMITVVSCLGQLIGVIDWAYLSQASTELNWMNSIGLTLMVFGISFRVWSIRTLDEAFSATVQIKEGQELITSGPYKWFRHPSYTGAWILMIGDALVLQSWTSFAIMSLGMLWAYSRRIEVEEKALARAFGAAYVKHERCTWRMLPGW